MRVLAICVLLLAITGVIMASNVDAVLNSIGTKGRFIEHPNAGKIFVSNHLWSDEQLSEEDAYDYCTRMALFFLMIRGDWIDYTPSETSTQIKQLQRIGAPYATQYQNRFASIQLWKVEEEVDLDVYLELGEEGTLNRITSIVRNRCDLQILDWFLKGE